MADIFTLKPFASKVITAGTTVNSSVYPIALYKPLGNFGSQMKAVGDGEVSVSLFVSLNDGESFVEYPGKLWKDKTAGEYAASHGVCVCTHFYLAASVVGGTTTTVDLWFGIQ